MKRILKLALLLLFIVVTKNVYAVDKCTSEEMQRLKNLANNVQVKTDYLIDEEDSKTNEVSVSYNVKLLNNSREMWFKYETNTGEKVELSNSNLEIKGLRQYEKLKIYVYAYVDNLCVDNLLRTITVEFPEYNAYYYHNKEKCKNAPGFEYCEEFTKVNKSFEEIDKLYEEYVHGEKNPVKHDDNNENKINLYFIIGGVILILFVVGSIILIVRKKKMDSI